MERRHLLDLKCDLMQQRQQRAARVHVERVLDQICQLIIEFFCSAFISDDVIAHGCPFTRLRDTHTHRWRETHTDGERERDAEGEGERDVRLILLNGRHTVL